MRTRNSHNNLNESGNLIKGSKEVNIMHMDAKPFMIAFVTWGIAMFLFFTFIISIMFYTIHVMNQKIDTVTHTVTTTVDNK